MFWLVVWNMIFICPFSSECHHPNWRTHIFQRGRSTTNQTCFFWDLFDLWNHQIQRSTNLGAVTWVTSARFNPSHSMWNLCSAGPEMNMEIYIRKASVRLGSFRFVETSNRGGSVHQQAGSFRFAWHGGSVRFGSVRVTWRFGSVRFVLCSVAGREVFDRMGVDE